MKHKWVPKEKISRHLPMAVIASEDNRFASHNGFDFKEISKAIEENKKRKKARGASTISQQTAKNVFLWPSSSWIRKGFEVYFTVLIELMWDKERIMEVYLNSIEMGDGIYGAEAVAKAHFHTTASQLTRKQCALIAASLPNPRKYNSGKPSPYMYKRQRKIMYLMKCVPTFRKVQEIKEPESGLRISFQNRKSNFIFDCQNTGYKHCDSSNNLCKHRFHIQHQTNPVNQSANHTGHSINLFTEYQRNFVNKYITQHPSCCTGNTSHNNSNPERIP